MKLTPSSTARRRHALGFIRILGLAPDARAGDAHRAKAEPVHFEVLAEGERFRCLSPRFLPFAVKDVIAQDGH
jgi:hypothetical protein